MPAPRVSIIIVNWNGKGFLDECLTSLEEQTYRDFEVILVDNGSSDGSCDYLRALFPWVRLVPLELNVGFAAGNNAGYALARGSLIVTLNNDTRADVNWLSELVRIADSEERVGMVASCICQYQRPELIDSLGVRICADGMSRGAFRLHLLAEATLQNGDEVLVPSACAALYKRDMIKDIGFFDADYFAYCEDTDLGLRGRLAGWKALIAKDAVVLHKYSGTGGAFSPLKLYLVERNHYWVAIKNFPLPLLVLLPFWTCVRYAVQVGMVLSGKGSGAEFRASASPLECLCALAKATRDALAGLPGQWQKRSRIYGTKRMRSYEMARLIMRFRLSFFELLDGKANERSEQDKTTGTHFSRQ
jgi:GT2 family glycosyltransferase